MFGIALIALLIIPILFLPASHAEASVSSEQSQSSTSNANPQPKPILAQIHDFVMYVKTRMKDPAFAKLNASHKHTFFEYAPIIRDPSVAKTVGRQGQAGLWGTCGECVIGNTLNLALNQSFTEADIVNYVMEKGLCVPETGGMTLYQMVDAYDQLLARTNIQVFGYGDIYSPELIEVANKIDHGYLINLSVYGEMMREGGHTGEGDTETTHWILVHSVIRNADNSIAGFGITDSASSMTTISLEDLQHIYRGYAGTNLIDSSVIELFRWVPFTYRNFATSSRMLI